MSQLVAVREYSDANQLLADYAARKRRFAAMRSAEPVEPVAVVEPEPEPEPVDPLEDAITRYRLAFDSGFSLEGSLSTSKQIMREVARDVGCSVTDLKSDSRLHALARARQYAVWLIAKRTTLSLPAIGRAFNRDHTTILHSVRVMNRLHGENVRACGTDQCKRDSRPKKVSQ